MSLLEHLLTEYNQSKLSLQENFLPDHPAITELRELSSEDQNNIFKVYQCFVENLPKEKDPAYRIYKELMQYIAESSPIEDTVSLLNFLIKENLTTQNISDLVYEFCLIYNSNELTGVLGYLKNSQILTQENLNDLGFVFRLVVLNELSKIPDVGILSQEMFDLLKRSSINKLVSVKRLLARNLVNSQNLVRWLQFPQNSFLLTTDAFRIVWNRLPSHLLTQAVLDQLIRLSQQQNPEQPLREYVNQLIGFIENQVALNQEFVLNDQQSTHRASVHQSVSDSASKLFNLYSTRIEGNRFQDILQMIHDYIMQLPEDSIKNIAAKKGMDRIINLTFTDPGSGLTIPQLLALSFLAVHDSDKRIGILSDAREQFVEGLYEIQRGYNLLENGHDRGGPDMPICIGGTFNKLIEKLEGIHPDVKVLHITPATASLKLPIVVREVALDYLASLAKSQTPEELGRFKQLIDQIRQEECVEIIWEHIKPKIVDRMFDEFGSLYTGKADPRFNDFIESGQYLKLENLSRFQEQIMASPDYQPSSLTFFSHLSASDSDLSCSPQSPDTSRRPGS